VIVGVVIVGVVIVGGGSSASALWQRTAASPVAQERTSSLISI